MVGMVETYDWVKVRAEREQRVRATSRNQRIRAGIGVAALVGLAVYRIEWLGLLGIAALGLGGTIVLWCMFLVGVQSWDDWRGTK